MRATIAYSPKPCKRPASLRNVANSPRASSSKAVVPSNVCAIAGSSVSIPSSSQRSWLFCVMWCGRGLMVPRHFANDWPWGPARVEAGAGTMLDRKPQNSMALKIYKYNIHVCPCATRYGARSNPVACLPLLLAGPRGPAQNVRVSDSTQGDAEAIETLIYVFRLGLTIGYSCKIDV